MIAFTIKFVVVLMFMILQDIRNEINRIVDEGVKKDLLFKLDSLEQALDSAKDLPRSKLDTKSGINFDEFIGLQG